MSAHSGKTGCANLLSRYYCGFGHKVKFVGHKMRICAHGFISTARQQKRKPMISVGFARVSKKRPCRICGKPTYCGFSRDEGTSICMRISAGARGLSMHPEFARVMNATPLPKTEIVIKY